MKKRREWKKRFLKHLETCARVYESAARAGITANTAYKLYEKEPKFAAAWDAAIESAGDRLEAEAWRRGHEGTLTPKTIANEREEVREYSDTLLIFLLKGIRPKKYRDNYQVALSNPDGSKLSLAPQQTVMALIQTDPEVARVALKLAEAQVIDFDAAKLLKAPADEKRD
jgi:hypothetical protein